MLSALVVISFFTSVVSLTIGIRMELERRSPLMRLQRQTHQRRELTPEEAELRRPFLVRFVGPVAQHLLIVVARVSPQAMKDGVRRRLLAAGNPWHASSEEVIVVKVVFAITGALTLYWGAHSLAGMDFRDSFIGGVLGAAAGFILPDALIQRQTRERRRLIQRSLPYVLDLLCISVEAGLAFDAAMQKVADKAEGPLSEEFNRVAYEVRIGKPRRDALRDVRDRCGVEDLSTFVAAVIQAERLGLGIGHVLRVQADQMRVLRRERARETAMKIPVKMLFPLVFLILPTVFVIILGPAILTMMETLSATGGP